MDVDAHTTSVELVDEAKAGLVLSALAAAVREEPKSKVVAIDGGALAIAVKYLADTSSGLGRGGARARPASSAPNWLVVMARRRRPSRPCSKMKLYYQISRGAAAPARPRFLARRPRPCAYLKLRARRTRRGV